MTTAAMQSSVPSSDDCLPIHDAVALLGVSLRSVQLRCEAWAKRNLAHKAAPRDGKGKPIWWINRAADHRLARIPDRQTRADRDRATLLERFPAAHVEEAFRKFRWLTEWRNRCTSRHRPQRATDLDLAKRVAIEARAAEGDGFKISARSLQTWHRAVNALGPDGKTLGIAALVPKYTNSGEAQRSAEAIEYFYGCYHTQNRDSVAACHARTLSEAKRSGWLWPASYSATARWLRDDDDRSITLLMRDPDKWKRTLMPHRNIDYSLIAPGDLFVADHAQCDFWVTAPGAGVNGADKQIRPWLTAIMDCRTRCVVGWNLGVSPNQDGILSSLQRAFTDWCIPRVMRIDNGKDFCAKTITGVTKRERDALRKLHGRDWQRVLARDAALVDCEDSRWLGVTGELGIELIYAIPYAPWSKGIVERWFGTFHGQCGKTFATYCGNSALTRPECLQDIRSGYTRAQKRTLRKKHGRKWKAVAALKLVDQSAVPTLDEARDRVAGFIDTYHHGAHRGRDMGGDTPLGAWSTATSLRRALESELLFLMQGKGYYKVGANGVTITVGGGSITYGKTCPKLTRLKGRKVFITMDPHDTGINHCFAWTPDRNSRRLIGRLESNKRYAPFVTTEDQRTALAEEQRDRAVMHKAQRTAANRTRTGAERANRHARRRVAELRKTGTDDRGAGAAPAPDIVVVRTGFEGASTPVQGPSVSPPVDRTRRDLTAAAAALSADYEPTKRTARRGINNDALRCPESSDDAPGVEIAQEEVHGKDAARRPSDLLSLIAGSSHDRG